MIPTALRQFMTSLLPATEERKVEWANGAVPNTYYCSHKSYDLHLNYNYDEDAETGFYWFRIKNGDQDVTFSVLGGEGDFNFMNNLAAAVRVNASKLDLKISDFFD